MMGRPKQIIHMLQAEDSQARAKGAPTDTSTREESSTNRDTPALPFPAVIGESCNAQAHAASHCIPAERPAVVPSVGDC